MMRASGRIVVLGVVMLAMGCAEDGKTPGIPHVCVPSSERCDGLDNDCDNNIDEDLVAGCPLSLGVCSSAFATCKGTSGWSTCGTTEYGAEYLETEDGSVDAAHCDSLDNDCDGQTDEGCPCTQGAQKSCGTDVGECIAGTQHCIDERWGECVNATGPTTETCDELDNDCDGLTDEDGCTCNNGETILCGSAVGECSRGLQQCVDGQWGSCLEAVGPTDEVCDGLDNDCDGDFDEELLAQECANQTGVCIGSTKSCLGHGGWGDCGAVQYGAGYLADETPAAGGCDGLDNDCDDTEDEDCTCIYGDEQVCGSDVGECTTGIETCTVNGDFSECNAVGPAAEVCDGKNNDCDDETDEGLIAPNCALQQGVCAGTKKTCGGVDGWLDCTATTFGGDYVGSENGATDVAHCDGLDNDCDGQTDEGCPCSTGESALCGSSTGECAQGLQHCINGLWGPCENSTEPTAEICDGKNNDCDEETDEELVAPDCALQIGVCAGAKKVCLGLQGWSDCTANEYGDSYLADETPEAGGCDTLDNDCDTRTDEDCSCVDGTTQICGSDIGECQTGIQTCVNGVYGDCRDQVESDDEVCDGLDNNCTGEADEGLTPPNCALQLGVCAGSKRVCGGLNGWLACDGVASYGPNYRVNEDPTADATVCDGRDNDCDGVQDENCECVNGATQVCGTNTGECRQGLQTCAGGRWGICVDEIPPAVEICDGLDNNCDTDVDNGVVRPNCSLTQGVCAGAKKRCDSVLGDFVDCTAADYGVLYQAIETFCDGRDNDCDGEVDENNCSCVDGAIKSCGSEVGFCQSGTQFCAQGQWGPCEGAVYPGDEVCNGYDDDCDGNTDEVDDVGTPDCSLSLGVCAGSTKICGGVSGFLECAAEEYGPLWEVDETLCDGRDNDCDGDTDEACFCAELSTQSCGSDIGACQSGTQTCVGSAWGTCENEIQPSVEECNGVDDDCDTAIDEHLTLLCPLQVGVCAGAVSTCTAAEFPTCGVNEYGPDFALDDSDCDGRDNDCDAVIDEDCGPPNIIVSEVLYDEVGDDTGKALFVELFGPVYAYTGGLSLRAINGNGGVVYQTVELPNMQIPFNGYFLVADTGAAGTLLDIADFVADIDLQNGPDSVELVWNAGTASETIIDALGYGDFTTAVFAGEGNPAIDVGAGESLTRNTANSDTNDNATDFSRNTVPTPGGMSISRIHINLSWDQDLDLDLHLLNDGATFSTAPGDCFFDNRNPDWGVLDDPADDPSLDRDDIAGDGPEYVDLAQPADGTYLIEIDPFSLNGQTPTATVKVFFDGGGQPGVNEFEFTRLIPNNETYWVVARVHVIDNNLTLEAIDTTSLTAVNN